MDIPAVIRTAPARHKVLWVLAQLGEDERMSAGHIAGRAPRLFRSGTNDVHQGLYYAGRLGHVDHGPFSPRQYYITALGRRELAAVLDGAPAGPAAEEPPPEAGHCEAEHLEVEHIEAAPAPAEAPAVTPFAQALACVARTDADPPPRFLLADDGELVIDMGEDVIRLGAEHARRLRRFLGCFEEAA